MATLPHVREVSLRGMIDGTPHLLIGAASSFIGLRFRELSISALVGERDARLIQAYNSRRFFAFCERTFFSTPHVYGDVRVDAIPPRIRVAGILHAEMHGEREPVSVAHEEWEVTVHLPKERRFYARLSGLTRRYPFLAGDVVDLPRFRGEEWIVREDAVHAKSKTYGR